MADYGGNTFSKLKVQNNEVGNRVHLSYMVLLVVVFF